MSSACRLKWKWSVNTLFGDTSDVWCFKVTQWPDYECMHANSSHQKRTFFSLLKPLIYVLSMRSIYVRPCKHNRYMLCSHFPCVLFNTNTCFSHLVHDVGLGWVIQRALCQERQKYIMIWYERSLGVLSMTLTGGNAENINKQKNKQSSTNNRWAGNIEAI